MIQHADEIAEREIFVANNTLDLVELGEVRAIDGFVAKHAIDGEHARGLETGLRDVVQHARAHRGGVRAKNILIRLRALPRVLMTDRAVPPGLVHLTHAFHVILRRKVHRRRRLHKKRVVRVSRRVLLRLNQRVEIPKSTLHEVIRRHLREPQREENLPKRLSNLEQRVHVPARRLRPRPRHQIIRLKRLSPPRPFIHHLLRQIRRQHLALERELRPLRQFVLFPPLLLGQFSLLRQRLQRLRVHRLSRLQRPERLPHVVLDRLHPSLHPRRRSLHHRQPIPLHRLLEPDVRRPRSRARPERVQRHPLRRHARVRARLGRSALERVLALRRERRPRALDRARDDHVRRREPLDDADDHLMIDAAARARGRRVRDAVAGDRGEDVALDRVGVGHRARAGATRDGADRSVASLVVESLFHES